MGSVSKCLGIVGCFSVVACEWNVINAACRVTDPVDFAETTGTETVVAFHSHRLRNGWHVSEDEDNENAKKKKFSGAEV